MEGEQQVERTLWT